MMNSTEDRLWNYINILHDNSQTVEIVVTCNNIYIY